VRVKLPAGATARAVAAGLANTLALTRGGTVLAWGDNSAGQLGNGTTTSRLRPVRVKLPAGTKVGALVAGKFFGMVWAGRRFLTWGDNGSGELGNRTPGPAWCGPARGPPCQSPSSARRRVTNSSSSARIASSSGGGWNSARVLAQISPARAVVSLPPSLSHRS
jgi:hypothetical protein